MATDIAAVQTNHVQHCLLLDINVDTVIYRISNAFNPIIFEGETYQPVGTLLGITEISEDLKATNGDISVSLSGIDQTAIYSVLQATIKGGELVIRRAFFTNSIYDPDAVYERFRGVITSYAVSEDQDEFTGKVTSTVTITAASINSLLDGRVAGQRTLGSDRKRLYANDESFDRVADLHNVSFDFGKPYTAPAGFNGTNQNGGSHHPELNNLDVF